MKYILRDNSHSQDSFGLVFDNDFEVVTYLETLTLQLGSNTNYQKTAIGFDVKSQDVILYSFILTPVPDSLISYELSIYRGSTPTNIYRCLSRQAGVDFAHRILSEKLKYNTNPLEDARGRWVTPGDNPVAINLKLVIGSTQKSFPEKINSADISAQILNRRYSQTPSISTKHYSYAGVNISAPLEDSTIYQKGKLKISTSITLVLILISIIAAITFAFQS